MRFSLYTEMQLHEGKTPEQLYGEVLDGDVQPELEPPLLYYRRSWGVWSPVHEDTDPDAVSIPAIEVSGRDLRWQGAEL